MKYKAHSRVAAKAHELWYCSSLKNENAVTICLNVKSQVAKMIENHHKGGMYFTTCMVYY